MPMPKFKAKVSFVSLEVKFKKAANSLAIRVRTAMIWDLPSLAGRCTGLGSSAKHASIAARAAPF